jgi:type I restriction-modification system DNA methylase subunit
MRRKVKSVADQHQDWLGQVDTDGPFLALPVLKDIWPQGVERLGDADDRMITFKQAYLQWQHAFDTYTESIKTDEVKERYDAIARAWIELVLDQLAGWQDLRIPADDPRLTDLAMTSPGGEITVQASGALDGRDDDLGALLLVSAPTIDLRAKGLDGWAATEIDRMAMLVRKARAEVGIVTDGQWWAIVWAKDGKPTGSGMVNALTWAEEPLLRDAFLTLIDQRRFRAKETEQRLSRLFERSELEAEVITEALGTQVRKSVELLVQAFSEARLGAAERGDPDPLTDKPDDVYQAAVTIMMRVVFLLFAEQRDMLPTEQLYWDSYAVRELLDDLQQYAVDGEEHLDETYDAWHRLLAVSQALFAGVNYDEMRMPAYGGSLLDPARFAWLHATNGHGLRLKVSDRVMLHVFDSVQSVVVKNERRRISFRDIDVEQIGYIYEGLLGYTCQTVKGDVVLGLVGKDGEEPEITLGRLQQMYDDSTGSKAFAAELVAWIKDDQPAATTKMSNAIAKLVDKDLTKDEKAELTRLLTPVASHDPELLAQLVSWGNLIRRDLRDIPYVVPVGGLVVSETPSRKNAGAHYTPRSLAEEVVKYALEPLVYEPGPLQTNDENAWKLKSSTAILDLKVADIAAGSGAFLVAAARFLADRVTEAWTDENMLSLEEQENPKLTNDRAIREVIARCLYGADINPMAVEMCKLSLWLVSMDKTKPFSFVDEKIFCGNSLLGITCLEQLRALHIYPDPKRPKDLLHELIDIDGKIAEAIRLRKELASPIDEHNPMRSTRGKTAMLEQFEAVTADLRLIADCIVAVGLPLSGKPGAKLDDAYKVLGWELAEAFTGTGSLGEQTELRKLIDSGLAPSVETDFQRWQPLHWILEAPDAFVERRGFDAIIGNPPFLGGSKITGAMGLELRDWIVNVVAGSRRGNADLVAFFFLRAMRLLTAPGGLGLIATNTISQGDTREVGLDTMVAEGFTITRAIKSRAWPSASANLQFAAVWGANQSLPDGALRVIDDATVRRISTLLEPGGRVDGRPFRLGENQEIAYQGMFILGKGFLLDPSEALAWVAADPANREVLFPYLNGEDLNTEPNFAATRWVIDFFDRSEAEARRFELPFARLLERVKPERANNPRPHRRNRWWQFAELGRGLRAVISEIDRMLVMAQVSNTLQPAFVSSGVVPSNKVIVFGSESDALLAMLASSMHFAWTLRYTGSMRTDLSYSPSDVFLTFARPTPTARLEAIGRVLDEERRMIMLNRGLGLTGLYNLVNSPEVRHGSDILRLREVHSEIDEATMAGYGWEDVALGHGFHTYRHMERWTVSPAARIEILDRLLELNHQRAREEGQDVPDQGELI